MEGELAATQGESEEGQAQVAMLFRLGSSALLVPFPLGSSPEDSLEYSLPCRGQDLLPAAAKLGEPLQAENLGELSQVMPPLKAQRSPMLQEKPLGRLLSLRRWLRPQQAVSVPAVPQALPLPCLPRQRSALA